MTKCPSCSNEIHERFCPWCGYDAKKGIPVEVHQQRPNTRVYVVQNQYKNGVPKFDLSAANRFGALVFCLSPEAKPFHSQACIKELHLKLRNIRGHDHLLLLGNPCLIGWAVAIASHYSGGPLNLLQWEKRVEGYVVVQCDVMKTN